MPYSIDFIENEGGLIVTWSGTANGPDVIQSYRERFSPPDRLVRIKYIITDYTDVDGFNVSSDEVREIANIANAASLTNRTLFGVAVMPTDIEYGVARMFQSYADDDTTGWRTYVTRSRADGEAWLRGNLDPNLSFKNPT